MEPTAPRSGVQSRRGSAAHEAVIVPDPKTDPVLPLVVGTAGHVDHGKSALVEALTGVHPDRLREERERGMTIDLGFARLELEDGRRAGIVDVPGHERFVKNMVAGASGVDAVLFVVAADDGVMPQTREHLAILEFLGVRRGVVALTKSDLVSDELRELAAEDVRDLVRGTFLERVPLVPTSVATGAGLDELARELRQLLTGVAPRSDGGVFRMPVQRVFTAPGLGTVVTGIPLSGRVAPGDELEVVPGGARGRVRGLQAYHVPVERARAGHSTAIVLSDVARADVRRGRVVARPGFFRPSTLVAARVQALPGLARAIADRTAVRVHVGTAEALGELVLLDARELAPGANALAQLRLDEPVACAAGDRFVLRRASPLATLGGGVVLEDGEHRLKAFKPRVLEDLARRADGLATPEAMLVAVLARPDADGLARPDADELARAIKREPAEVRALCAGLAERGTIAALEHGRFVHAGRLDEALGRLSDALDRWFAEHPHRERAPLLDLVRASGMDQDVVLDLVREAERRGLVEHQSGGHVRRIGGARADVDAELDARAAAALLELERAALQPPEPAELAARLGWGAAETTAVLELLVDRGRARRVGTLVFAEARVAEARAAVLENCRAHAGALDIPSLRDRLATSRKYLIPLLEAFDAEGLTLRQGARRVLRARRGGAGG